MDAVTDHLPSRPITVDEATRLGDGTAFDLVQPFAALSKHPDASVVVVYVETDAMGDYYGFDPERGVWKHVSVADVSDDPAVHARAAAYLFAWLDTVYPNTPYVLC